MQDQDLRYILIIIITLLSTTATACAIYRKGLSRIWIFLSLFFSPIFLIVELLPNKNKHSPTIIPCPLCHKEISSEVRKCHYCGHSLPRQHSLIALIYERLICIVWILGIILIIIGMILSISDTSSQSYPKSDYTQSDTNSLPNDSDNDDEYPHIEKKFNQWNLSSSKDYVIISYVQCNGICKTKVNPIEYVIILQVNKKAKTPLFSLLVSIRSNTTQQINLNINGYRTTLKFFQPVGEMYMYARKIPYEETEAFLHAFTSVNSGYITSGNTNIYFTLNGTSAVVNQLIQEVEREHISLPPPFKSFPN